MSLSIGQRELVRVSLEQRSEGKGREAEPKLQAKVGFKVTKGTSDSTHLTVVYGTSWLPSQFGQATKGTRWMPRHQEAMKDAETCEMPRGAGLELRSVDIRMGKPGGRHGPSSHTEYIGV
jgi:hypothetical protein